MTLAKIGSRPILGVSVVNVTQVGEGHGADVGFWRSFGLVNRVEGWSCAKRILVGLASVARMAAM